MYILQEINSFSSNKQRDSPIFLFQYFEIRALRAFREIKKVTLKRLLNLCLVIFYVPSYTNETGVDDHK